VPLTYPAWFSEQDRARIDDALLAADAPHDDSDDEVRGRSSDAPRFASSQDAMRAVLVVYEAVAQTLSAQRDRQTLEAVQAAADDLLDQIIVWADRKRLSSATTREAFAAAVREAVRKQAWWTPRLLAPSAMPRPDPER
jgi:hypothetical protein